MTTHPHKPPPLLGEFTEIDVAALACPPNAGPLAKAHTALVQELARLHVPEYGTDPTPGQHEDVADYLLRVCQAMDRLVGEIRQEVQANATSVKLDDSCFRAPFVGAVDGMALFEIDRAATALREEYREAGWRASPYRALGAGR